jgi:ATPase subunit of ABC transporter with duplicated ATPase domains
MIKFPGTVLFSSHDQQFIQTVANRVIEVGSKGVEDFDRPYDEYLMAKLAGRSGVSAALG